MVEGTSFDQILDLGSVADTNKSQTEIPVSAPIMAFEESIQQQNNNNTAAGTTSFLVFKEVLGQVLKELLFLSILDLPLDLVFSRNDT